MDGGLATLLPDSPTIAPGWRAIGVEQGKGAEWWYIFEAHGRVLRMRGNCITAPGHILTLDGDIDRWRRMFPHPHSRSKFDALAAAGWLVRECWAAQIRREDAAETSVNGPAPVTVAHGKPLVDKA